MVDSRKKRFPSWIMASGQQWRRTIDGSHLWSTASSGGSVVVNRDVRDFERSLAVGEQGQVSPQLPWSSSHIWSLYCLATASLLFRATMIAHTALQREEQFNQGKGWIRKKEEMTR